MPHSDKHTLKDSLCSMSFISSDALPNEGEDLAKYLSTALSHAAYLINTLPDPPPTSDESSFKPIPANSASDPAETLCDLSAVPIERHPELADLQKSWGKPIKLSAKDNPLSISCYKMAAHDRYGAWFARRSVHQGVGFARFKAAMQREFLTSLKDQSRPGAGAVRGISADKRLGQRAHEQMGRMEVWQLSSAFPGPVTPREFVTCLTTSSAPLPTTTAGHGDESEEPRSSSNDDSESKRTFMVISRPTDHDEAPERAGLVKGTYESIELIREVPVSKDDPESNPVEWIMITRSDPGGGIPRFLVERGTPSSIVADVPKFLKWAIGLSEDELNEDLEKARDLDTADSPDAASTEKGASGVQEEGDQKTPTNATHDSRHDSTPAAQDFASSKNNASESTSKADEANSKNDENSENNTGVYTQVASAITATSGYIGSYLHGPNANDKPQDSDTVVDADDPGYSSDTSSASTTSTGTFLSANPGVLPDEDQSSIESFPGLSNDNAAGVTDPELDKSLQKLADKRQKLDERVKRAREQEEVYKHSASDKPEKEREKALAKIDREMKKEEDRYAREVEKLDAKHEKEVLRFQEKERKKNEKEEVYKIKKERDGWKQRALVAETETRLLKKRLEETQRENAELLVKVGGAAAHMDAENGDGHAASLSDSLGHSRGTSGSGSLNPKAVSSSELSRKGHAVGGVYGDHRRDKSTSEASIARSERSTKTTGSGKANS